MADQYELAELRQSVGRRLGGFYNSFRYAANRALWILPHLSVGKLFTDTLGKFYPFQVNSGGNITLNTSPAFPATIVFHNTGASVADAVVSMTAATSLIFARNNAVAGTMALYINNSMPQTRQGFAFTANATYELIQANAVIIWEKTHVIWTKLGIPSDADFPNDVADGMIVLDITDNRLYVRSNAVWRFAALT